MVFETGIPFIITYFSTLIFVFLGLYVGAILAYISPEEMKPGTSYFKAFGNALLVFILLILFYAYGIHLLILVILGIAASAAAYYTSDIPAVSHIAYLLLGIVFFYSTKSSALFITISAMIFLYGLPLGSLYVANRPKKSKRTVLSDMFLSFGFFLIIALVSNLIAIYVSAM